MTRFRLIILIVTLFLSPILSVAQDDMEPDYPSSSILYDDQALLDGYTKKYEDLSKEILLAMIKDDTLTAYKSAAAIRNFRLQYSKMIVGKEKKAVERNLLHLLNRTDSAFVEVELMHTLCIIDRYRYFDAMVPTLIRKLDHYNSTVNAMAYGALNSLIDEGNNRTREARIVFQTIRKVLFLSRKRLADMTEPNNKLQQKLKLLRWSVKVLGTQELKKLPKEVLSLL